MFARVCHKRDSKSLYFLFRLNVVSTRVDTIVGDKNKDDLHSDGEGISPQGQCLGRLGNLKFKRPLCCC